MVLMFQKIVLKIQLKSDYQLIYVVPDIVPLMNRDEMNCLNFILAYHIEEELVHEEFFKETLKIQAREQLPFRRFISFEQFVELLFQSRTPDALGGLERELHADAEYYLTTDQDRVDQTYIIEQECEWKNARALREAPNNEARFKEFVRQVRDSVNQQVAGQVAKYWNLDSTLPRDKYLAWIEARESMTSKINEEVANLRNQRKDAQWLCEHATHVAEKFSAEEIKILMGRYTTSVKLEISDLVSKARGIEKAMERTKDFRYAVIKTLADQYAEGTRCFTAFLELVQNHRRFDIALAFVDEEYIYPQFFCKSENSNFRVISTRFCKCLGSFCVIQSFTHVFAKEYALEQGLDGTYRVVLSGSRTREKVQA